MTDRIAISKGFFIKFSTDGRAISAGREEYQVLPEVLFWLHSHPHDENYKRVQDWCAQKAMQIQEDRDTRSLIVRREEINEWVDRSARESGLRDKETVELLRAEIFRMRGVPQYEE